MYIFIDLVTLRESLGYSRKEVACFLGVSVRTLEKYERGELDIRRMAAVTFLRLSYLYKFDPMEILYFR